MFGDLVILYLFFGGAGAGAVVVLCVLEFLDAQRHLGQRRRALVSASGLQDADDEGNAPYAPRLPRNFYARAWPIAACMLGFGIVCLLCDIGRPDRIFALVVHPEFSPMTVGAYALVIALAIALVFGSLSLFDGMDVRSIVIRSVAVVGVAAGVVTVTYTGVLLADSPSVLFWQTPLVPVLFALSSLSSGFACVLLALSFTESRQTLVMPAGVFSLIDSALIVLELLCLTALIVWGLMGEGTRASAFSLFWGELKGWFWLCVVVLGLVAPFSLERFAVSEGRRFQLLWTSVLLLVGALALRWCIVEAGSFDTTQTVGAVLGYAAFSG